MKIKEKKMHFLHFSCIRQVYHELDLAFVQNEVTQLSQESALQVFQPWARDKISPEGPNWSSMASRLWSYGPNDIYNVSIHAQKSKHHLGSVLPFLKLGLGSDWKFGPHLGLLLSLPTCNAGKVWAWAWHSELPNLREVQIPGVSLPPPMSDRNETPKGLANWKF